MAIDDRTTNLNFPKPHQDNTLLEDVARLRAALDAIDAEIQSRQATLGFTPENAANKGLANGYAGLDGTGRVPASMLPSFVDDVVEYATFDAFPATGEGGKIYVTLDTNQTYRWSGTVYVEISAAPGSTDAVVEGLTNLYFTAARARSAQNIASASVLGLVKIGSGLAVDEAGTVSADGAGQTFEDFLLSATANGQTAFTVNYTPGAIDVHLNGVKLNGGGDDYTATSGTGITLTAGINTTDLLVMRRWATFEVANMVTPAGVQTLTGKTLSVDLNTISGLAESSFVVSNADGSVDGSADAKIVPVGSVVGTTDEQTLTNKTLTGYTETVFALSGASPSISASNGTVQTWTLIGNSSPSSSLLSGQSVTLMIDDGLAFAITWPSVIWKSNSGVAPTLNTTGFTSVVLWRVGSALYGARVGDA